MTIVVNRMLLPRGRGAVNVPVSGTSVIPDKPEPGTAIKMILLALIAVFCLNTPACTDDRGKYIEVFAGSASKPALDEIAVAFEKKTGIAVRRVYGGSGSVLSSMLISGRGDVYLPGSHDFMATAVDKKAVDKTTIRIVAYLVPVIAVQKGNPRNIRRLVDLLRDDVSFSVGNPSTVCVGLYAVEVFENAGLAVSLRKKVATYAENCEKTATHVSLKAVDAVIGWDVFGKWNPGKIEVVYIDKRFVKRSAYIPAAIVSNSKNMVNAKKFIAFLTSDEGKNIFRTKGYKVTEKELYDAFGPLFTGGSYPLHESWK